jgi:hypothetical protein
VGRIRPGESGTVEIELKAGISGAEDQQENGREEALFQAFQGYDLRAAAWPRAQGHRAMAVSGRERRARPSLDLRRKHEGAGPGGVKTSFSGSVDSCNTTRPPLRPASSIDNARSGCCGPQVNVFRLFLCLLPRSHCFQSLPQPSFTSRVSWIEPRIASRT